MFFIAAALAVLGAVLLQYFIYKKKGLESIEYSASLSSSEVFEGDDVYLYEEIRNNSALPIPYIKIDTELPDGLVFTLLEEYVQNEETESKEPGRRRGVVSSRTAESVREREGGVRSVKEERSIQSLFVLRPYARIRRRWRLTCKRRGEYSLTGSLVSGSDILGIHTSSKMIKLEGDMTAKIVVLPVPEDIAGKYTSSRFLCGDIITNMCPVSDPLRMCGAREYTPSDPMRSINWKSTATHGKLMVNLEEKTVRHRFSLLLNMNSRQVEKDDVPSDTGAIERCIKICAAILDRIAAEDVPVKVFVNTPTDLLAEGGGVCVSEDEVGSNIALCGPYRGKRDMILALRMLAQLKMKISVPIERVFDHIVANPECYNEYENMIIVTSYIDRRMLNLRDILARDGVRVIFYVATSRNEVGALGDEDDVYFRL